jgi:hypothetical protein
MLSCIYDLLCIDVGKNVGKTVVQIRNEVLGFVRVLLDQVKALPIYDNFKEQYKQVSKFLFMSVSETELTCTKNLGQSQYKFQFGMVRITVCILFWFTNPS